MEWFYADESRVQHAVALEELPSLVAAGTIRGGTLVWNESMADWKVAAEALPDLFPIPLAPPILSPAQRRDLGYQAGPGFPGQRAPVDTLAVLSLVFGNSLTPRLRALPRIAGGDLRPHGTEARPRRIAPFVERRAFPRRTYHRLYWSRLFRNPLRHLHHHRYRR